MISCVIPAYEQIDMVRRCLASAQAQTGVALEIIVTDDSHTSAIADFVAAAAQADHRVRYLRGPRTGVAVDNWNQGLDAARGDLFVVIHQDEWLTDPTYLARATAAMKRGDLAAAVAGTRVRGVSRPSRFALVSPIARRLPNPAWWLPAFNWIGPTAAFVFRGRHRFDARCLQLADVEFYHRVLRGRKWARLPGVSVASLGHHPGQITARISPHALAREELLTLATRKPPAISVAQCVVAHLATRFRSGGGR